VYWSLLIQHAPRFSRSEEEEAGPVPSQDDRVTADVMRALARVARLPEVERAADDYVEGYAGLLGFTDAWEGLGLAFSFEDGTFSYAQSVAQYHPLPAATASRP
jgi:hypothetical protein